jgi:hypothetical protein
LFFTGRFAMDALRHPDLVEVGRRLRRSFDRAAAAELEVARVAHARTRDLRDLLMEWEDAGARIDLTSPAGTFERMRIDAVGLDHVVLSGSGRTVALPLAVITSFESAS